MSTHLVAPSPAPVATPPAPVVLPVAVEVPAELVAAAAEVIPDASRAWVRSLLRDCGEYGLNLALLVVAWVKIQRAEKPTRYARVALAGWLNQLRSGELTLEDVRGEVHGRPGPRAGVAAVRPGGVPGTDGELGLGAGGGGTGPGEVVGEAGLVSVLVEAQSPATCGSRLRSTRQS